MVERKSPLWSADKIVKNNSELNNFCKNLENKKLHRNNQNFKKLWEWSIKNPENFWSEVWDFTKIKKNQRTILIHQIKIKRRWDK